MWNAFFQAADYQAIKPEILVTVFGLTILLLDFLVEKREKYLNAVAALIGLGFAAYQLTCFWRRFAGEAPYVGFDGRVTLDTLTIYLKLIIVLAAGLVLLISATYLD